MQIQGRMLPSSAELAAIATELAAVNQALWQIEDELRLCEQRSAFGQRLGSRWRHPRVVYAERP